jgi:site-specific DNA-cytosine methylase
VIEESSPTVVTIDELEPRKGKGGEKLKKLLSSSKAELKKEEKKREEKTEETRARKEAAEEELSEFMKKEDSLRRREQIEASERDKKRNKARGRRRKTTKFRLVREAVEAEKRSERPKVKKKKKGPPKGVGITLRGPVLIAVEERGNGRRLPRKSDAGTYVDRWLLGRRWRILVQPCWVGICSARKRLQEQTGREVEFRKRIVLRFAGQFKQGAIYEKERGILPMLEWWKPVKLERDRKSAEKSIRWVQDMTEHPYFLRPEFDLSGRAKPETIQKWRIEEDLANPKESKGWRSVGERRELRYQLVE